jgi:hypothetical protein
MADVDFSSAVLDANTYPMRGGNYMGLSDDRLWDSSFQVINTNRSVRIITNTITKVSVLFSGTFTASGTEFYLGYLSAYERGWRVSNIAFSSGDAYSFVIDIEVSGNT